jgi:serine/threonine-protein kinase
VVSCTTCHTALDSRATFCPNCGATVPDPLLETVVAGSYRVEKRIAIGGFGSIYRATDVATGEPLALKIMHRELAGDEALLARFRREGAVLAALRDPHTVTTYEHGETTDGLPFIAMELLEGSTLLDLMREHDRLPWTRAFAIGAGVCSALAEAHAHGIVHRDLKPANIVITAGDGVKVLDFGIAMILSSSDAGDPRELTKMGTAVGTVEYMAPEQLMGGRADRRTDLYTLGAVLYEAICGRRPYSGVGLDQLTQQLAGPPPLPSALVGCPVGVDRVLLRCLHDDRDERFATASDLADALRNP